MRQYIARRLFLAVVTLIGVSWLIFFIMWIIPGDVAIAILGDGANRGYHCDIAAADGSR